jgi:hypothetical protein
MTSTTFKTHRHLAKDLLVVAFTALLVGGFLAQIWKAAPRAPVETAAVVALR